MHAVRKSWAKPPSAAKCSRWFSPVLVAAGHNTVKAQENKSLHLKSLLWCGVTRWWLDRHGCKLGTAFRDFR